MTTSHDRGRLRSETINANEFAAEMSADILRAIDFPGTPINNLDICFGNTQYGLMTRTEWTLPARSGTIHPTSLSNLTSLKIGFATLEQWGWPETLPMRSFKDLMLANAGHLQELSVASINFSAGDGHCNFDFEMLSRSGLEFMRECASHLSLRKLEFRKIYDPCQVLGFAAPFRKTLTQISLLQITAEDPEDWSKVLQSLADFPLLEQVSLFNLRYAGLDDHYGDPVVHSCDCTHRLVQIKGNVAEGLYSIANTIEVEVQQKQLALEQEPESEDEDDSDVDRNPYRRYWDEHGYPDDDESDGC